MRERGTVKKPLTESLVNYCSTVVDDHEEEITKLLLDGGLNEVGRAAFCSVTRKDCRGDAVAEAAKRQSIADILSGVNPCGTHRVIASSRRYPTHWLDFHTGINDDAPPAAPAKKKRKRRKKKAAATEL